LAGHPPFQGDSAVDVMHAIVHQDPPELPDDVPEGLRAIVLRCLEKNPAKRFQSARDLAFALRSLSGGSTSHVSLPAIEAPAPSLSRWWIPAVLGAAVVTVIALLIPRGPDLPSGINLSAYEFHPFAFTQFQE